VTAVVDRWPLLGDRWTPAAAAAWTLAYRLVAETMLQGANSPAGP
jgi:hypothetical protein